MTTHKFNNGRPYHGSREVQGGKLEGSTAETDYFYFHCPICADRHILRVLDYEVRAEAPGHPYTADVTKAAKRSFTLAFHLYCENCKFTDFVKLSNTGWQGGTFAEVMNRHRGRT